ncbi:MAG TPA: alpha/beta fold hydrolase [Chitinophagaceae bacterium]|nr:alpha/beta fold hydrolase [Chitinophagaceae bacterium]
MRFNQRLALKYTRAKFKLLSTISKRKAAEKAFTLFCTPQYRNKKKLPLVFGKGEKLNFEFDKYKIQGYRWNGNSEKKILILHGFESSIVNFDRYVKPLINLGYCVMGFDAPAHGKSSGKMFNALLYRQFINVINNKYGPVTNFLAHSLGGLAACLTLEEWKHDKTFKVVLIAPATETSTAVNNFFTYLKLNGEVRKEFDSIINQKSGHSSEWFSIVRAAKFIKAKVLWLHDKDDHMTPLSDAQTIIEKKYPNFEFYITEGLGHRRIYRDNKVGKKVIEFFN